MLPSNLHKYFWDTDINELDAQKYKKYILERILEMGDEEAVKWMKKTYSQTDILETLKNNRKISLKSQNYWQLVLN